MNMYMYIYVKYAYDLSKFTDVALQIKPIWQHVLYYVYVPFDKPIVTPVDLPVLN